MALPNDLAGRIADAKNFYNRASTRPEDWGLTTTQLDDLKRKYELTEAAIDTQTAADSAKKAATADKNAKAGDFDRLYSQLRGVAQAHPETTDAMRASVNLATGEGNPTDASEFGIAPLLAVEQAGIHIHRLRFFMAGEDSTSTRKPDGAFGANLYVKIGGETSSDLKQYELMTMDRKQPYDYPHEPSDAGKIAHYIACWVDDDDVESPQSEIFSLVIT